MRRRAPEGSPGPRARPAAEVGVEWGRPRGARSGRLGGETAPVRGREPRPPRAGSTPRLPARPEEAEGRAGRSRSRARPGPRRPRHLVQLGAVAVLDPRLARPRDGADRSRPAAAARRRRPASPGLPLLLLPRLLPRHRARHHHPVGRPHAAHGALQLLGDVPFTDCFIHANIQDGKGERMSKSKGNGIDPADIIDTLRRRRHALRPLRHADRAPRTSACRCRRSAPSRASSSTWPRRSTGGPSSPISTPTPARSSTSWGRSRACRWGRSSATASRSAAPSAPSSGTRPASS
jgi:hypothetical protein